MGNLQATATQPAVSSTQLVTAGTALHHLWPIAAACPHKLTWGSGYRHDEEGWQGTRRCHHCSCQPARGGAAPGGCDRSSSRFRHSSSSTTAGSSSIFLNTSPAATPASHCHLSSSHTRRACCVTYHSTTHLHTAPGLLSWLLLSQHGLGVPAHRRHMQCYLHVEPKIVQMCLQVVLSGPCVEYSIVQGFCLTRFVWQLVGAWLK